MHRSRVQRHEFDAHAATWHDAANDGFCSDFASVSLPLHMKLDFMPQNERLVILDECTAFGNIPDHRVQAGILRHNGRCRRSEEHTSELQSHSFISYGVL